MTVSEIKEKLNDKEYDFLRTNENLKDKMMLLGLGGSYAYGTDTENSDIDMRGVAINSKKEILLGKDFEQIVDIATDTTVYSFNKMAGLLINCNPNTIEILGLKPEHYIYMNKYGRMLVDNGKLFLSKKAINTFGGYANSQLYRLNQKSKHSMKQGELEEHILNTLKFIMIGFKNKFQTTEESSINLYTDKSLQSNMETEIFMDINLKHYPLRDYCSMWAELQQVVRSYNKIGMRNKKAAEHNKIAKHSMHLIRLYMMCIDILENEKVITYREKEHNLLMSIRNGEYIDENNQVLPEFFELVGKYEERLKYAKENTSLPDLPDMNKINDLIMTINEEVIIKN